MKEIILDGNMLTDPETAYLYLKEKLELPQYFGNNLDALYDCFTDLNEAKIRINRPKQETDFFKRLGKVLRAAEKNGEILVEWF